jgi:hypothetical protein
VRHEILSCEACHEVIYLGPFQVLKYLLAVDDCLDLAQRAEKERLELVGVLTGDHRANDLIKVQITKNLRLPTRVNIRARISVTEQNATKEHDVATPERSSFATASEAETSTDAV